MIIGLTGTIGSGKDEVRKILEENFNFKTIKLSDVIKIFLSNKNFDRKTLQDLGNFLRKNFGNDILVKIVTFFYQDNIIIDGIRNLGEIEFLRKTFEKKFLLIAVDADQKMRFERILKRGREDDPKTFEEFLEVDKRDRGIDEPEYGQQVDECIKAADIKIVNEDNLENLKIFVVEKISQFLKNSTL